MNYFRFAMFNIIGGFLWVWSMLLGGFYLGRVFGDKINDYIHYLIIGVIFVSFIPIIIKWIKTRKETNKVA